MLQLAFEAFIVGILNLVIGFIISYISMGDKAKTFDHWTGVLLSFFITGCVIYLIYKLIYKLCFFCHTIFIFYITYIIIKI